MNEEQRLPKCCDTTLSFALVSGGQRIQEEDMDTPREKNSLSLSLSSETDNYTTTERQMSWIFRCFFKKNIFIGTLKRLA